MAREDLLCSYFLLCSIHEFFCVSLFFSSSHSLSDRVFVIHFLMFTNEGPPTHSLHFTSVCCHGFKSFLSCTKALLVFLTDSNASDGKCALFYSYARLFSLRELLIAYAFDQMQWKSEPRTISCSLFIIRIVIFFICLLHVAIQALATPCKCTMMFAWLTFALFIDRILVAFAVGFIAAFYWRFSS